jgi:hypothetical protein
LGRPATLSRACSEELSDFDLTMVVTGAMILAGAWFAWRALPRRAVLAPTALLGLGALSL